MDLTDLELCIRPDEWPLRLCRYIKSNREFLKCICVLVPAGEACRVRPVEGELAPHPTAVQATSTKL